jgi:hypothetical protein
MKLKITRYKPSGKYYDEAMNVSMPDLKVWEEDFKAELRTAIERHLGTLNHDFAHLVQNDPTEVQRSIKAETDLPFHNHLYFPGDLKP